MNQAKITNFFNGIDIFKRYLYGRQQRDTQFYKTQYDKQVVLETDLHQRYIDENITNSLYYAVDFVSPEDLKILLREGFMNPDSMVIMNYLFLNLGMQNPVRNSEIVNGIVGDLMRIGSESANGIALSGKSSEDNYTRRFCETFVVKYPRIINDRTKNEMLHEAMIGLLAINNLRKFCPNFVYTYGYFSCGIPILSPDGVVSEWCLSNTENTPYIALENITNSKDLYTFIDNDRTDIENFLLLYLQIIMALKIAYEQCDFSHGDLHHGNVIIRRVENVGYLKYTLNQDGVEKNFYLKCNGLIATIIDFGRSHAKIDGFDVCYPDTTEGIDSINFQTGNFSNLMNELQVFTSFFIKLDQSANGAIIMVQDPINNVAKDLYSFFFGIDIGQFGNPEIDLICRLRERYFYSIPPCLSKNLKFDDLLKRVLEIAAANFINPFFSEKNLIVENSFNIGNKIVTKIISQHDILHEVSCFDFWKTPDNDVTVIGNLINKVNSGLQNFINNEKNKVINIVKQYVSSLSRVGNHLTYKPIEQTVIQNLRFIFNQYINNISGTSALNVLAIRIYLAKMAVVIRDIEALKNLRQYQDKFFDLNRTRFTSGLPYVMGFNDVDQTTDTLREIHKIYEASQNVTNKLKELLQPHRANLNNICQDALAEISGLNSNNKNAVIISDIAISAADIFKNI